MPLRRKGDEGMGIQAGPLRKLSQYGRQGEEAASCEPSPVRVNSAPVERLVEKGKVQLRCDVK